MTREELITSNEYVQSQVQLRLLNIIGEYMTKHNLKRNQLAEQLKVSKGYVTQILNAEYDHKISKLVELSMACNKVPLLYFVDKDKFVENDAKDKIYELFPMQRPKNVIYTKANTQTTYYEKATENIISINADNSQKELAQISTSENNFEYVR